MRYLLLVAGFFIVIECANHKIRTKRQSFGSRDNSRTIISPRHSNFRDSDEVFVPLTRGIWTSPSDRLGQRVVNQRPQGGFQAPESRELIFLPVTRPSSQVRQPERNFRSQPDEYEDYESEEVEPPRTSSFNNPPLQNSRQPPRLPDSREFQRIPVPPLSSQRQSPHPLSQFGRNNDAQATHRITAPRQVIPPQTDRRPFHRQVANTQPLDSEYYDSDEIVNNTPAPRAPPSRVVQVIKRKPPPPPPPQRPSPPTTEEPFYYDVEDYEPINPPQPQQRATPAPSRNVARPSTPKNVRTEEPDYSVEQFIAPATPSTTTKAAPVPTSSPRKLPFDKPAPEENVSPITRPPPSFRRFQPRPVQIRTTSARPPQIFVSEITSAATKATTAAPAPRSNAESANRRQSSRFQDPQRRPAQRTQELAQESSRATAPPALSTNAPPARGQQRVRGRIRFRRPTTTEAPLDYYDDYYAPQPTESNLDYEDYARPLPRPGRRQYFNRQRNRQRRPRPEYDDYEQDRPPPRQRTTTTTTPMPNTTLAPTTTTRNPLLKPRKDDRYINWLGDPNLPRELKGTDLTDYPFYITVPEDITFKCEDHSDGFFASVPHHCQLFHYCFGESRYDFLCPNYTLYDQTTFTCRFVNHVDCPNSHLHFNRNDALYVETTTIDLKRRDDEEKRRKRRKKAKKKPKVVVEEEEEETEDEEEEDDDSKKKKKR